jgi:sec-independent protein translocase protein TatB
MQIFGVGIGEVIFILIIAIIVLGPQGMVKAAHTIGRTIRKIIRSPIWSMMMDTQRELRDIPTRLVREAGLEEDLEEIKKSSQELRNLQIDEINQLQKDLDEEIPSEPEGSVATERRIAPPPMVAPMELDETEVEEKEENPDPTKQEN